MFTQSRRVMCALLFGLLTAVPAARAQISVSGNPFQAVVNDWLPHKSWTLVHSPNPGGELDVFNAVLFGVADVAENDVWAVGTDSASSPSGGPETLVEHWDGTLWTAVPSPNRPSAENTLSATIFTAPDDGWAVGYTKTSTAFITLIEHWNGEEWRIVPSPNFSSGIGSSSVLSCITAVNGNDVWAGGWGIFLGKLSMLFEHWDGAAWTIVPVPAALASTQFVQGIDARAADDIWAVGYDESGVAMRTAAAHWNGVAWSASTTPNVTGAFTPDCKLLGVKIVTADDVWAVGGANNIDHLNIQQTIVEHWDGSSWSLVPSPNPATGGSTLRAVTFHGPKDVWAVGNTHDFDSGELDSLTMHWNGESWKVVPSPTGINATTLTAITIRPSGTAWAVGSTEVQGECCLRTIVLRNPHG
jgi:hypothetical protein